MGRKKKFFEKRITTAVRIPESLHNRLQEAADNRDTSINHLMVKAAAHYLEMLPPLDLPEDDLASESA